MYISYVIFLVGLAAYIIFLITLQPVIVRPLNRFIILTRKLSEGNYSERANIPWRDELGQLASSFNAMANQIEKSHEKLKQLTVIDSLTGVLNNRGFWDGLKNEMERSQRSKEPFTLALLDIDFFKKVNDNYGHGAGDTALKFIAEAINAEARTTDIVARYGGEEFAIIMGATSTQGGIAVAERIRGKIEEQYISINADTTIQLTASIGIASFPRHANNIKELFTIVDQALYNAKHNGRNRTRVSAEIKEASPGDDSRKIMPLPKRK
jgi:diguanylate cyclase (GGDEF)-like protein